LSKTLLKAVEKRTSFGRGDMYVLSMVRKTIDKLSKYYVFLSALFVVLYSTTPLFFPALNFALSTFFGLIMAPGAGIPFIGPFVGVLLFALLTIAVFRIAGKVKKALFGFSPADIFETDEMNASWVFHQRA
jgi:hypothetical protein